MSQSRDLQRHIVQLSEIRTILNSMKNMAFMEIHKLANFQNRQSLAVANIEQAAQDLLNFFPGLAFAEEEPLKHVFILLGSERGFCGDFNESLITALSQQHYDGLITIGNKLANRLNEAYPQVVSSIPGANTAEEVSAIIHQLIQAINKNSDQINNAKNDAFDIRLTIVYHGDVSNPIIQRQILPPFPLGQAKTLPRGDPPLLNLEPSLLFSDLIHHYLFAVLNEIFYTSLIAENQSRLQHLESAVNHLDKETIDLQSKLQMHRQEEITEEIEVILLNAEINQSF